MRETDIQRACLDWLHAKGIFCWRSNQIPVPLNGGGFRRFAGLKGVADILGILPQEVGVGLECTPVVFGNLLAVEVKMPKKKLRPEQSDFLREINDRGGIGLCVHSVDELERELEPYLEAGSTR